MFWLWLAAKNDVMTLVQEHLRPSPQETISWPMRCLFFKTTLVEAFESAPVSRISELNWDAMMEEARVDVPKLIMDGRRKRVVGIGSGKDECY
jgi:hypothetical protein